MEHKMSGRVCLITGATSGIGRETAASLAALGATVIIACRDLDRGGAVCRDLSTTHPFAQLHALRLDLASLASIEEFSGLVHQKFGQLHVLVNNAATVSRKRALTRDGFELQFGVNHLGHFLLTNRLLPLLEAAEDPRIVIVTSELHRAGTIPWHDLQQEKSYAMMRSYAQSKLANLLFARELARRMTHMKVNAVHPGAARTGIMRDAPAWARYTSMLMGGAPAKAAEPCVSLASSPSMQGSGNYYKGLRLHQPGQRACNDADASRLWEVSGRLVGI